MHKIKSMFLTLLCMAVILGVGYLVIMESGRKVLENGIMLEETDYESTSSNIFYGKIEEDIELFPWNYYPGDEAEVGWENEQGIHPLFQYSLLSDITENIEEELKPLQGWYLCQLIAYKTNSQPEEIWSIFEKRQHTLMDEIRMVENSPIGALFFYQDTLPIGGKNYQVRISFTQWNVISFICIEDRLKEASESDGTQEAGQSQGSAQSQVEGASQAQGSAQSQMEGISQESGSAQSQMEEASQESGSAQSQMEGASQESGSAQSQMEGASQDQGIVQTQERNDSEGTSVGQAQGDVQSQKVSDYATSEERQKAWEEGKEKLAKTLRESENQMGEYFAYMTFLQEWDDTAFYLEESGEYVNCYLKGLQWLDWIQKGETGTDNDNEMFSILMRMEEIRSMESSLNDSKDGTDDKSKDSNGGEEAEEVGEEVIETAPQSSDSNLLAEPAAESAPGFSYQIVDLKDMILLLMQGENTIGIFYDPIAQEFCGYNYFYEY